MRRPFKPARRKMWVVDMPDLGFIKGYRHYIWADSKKDAVEIIEGKFQLMPSVIMEYDVRRVYEPK